MSSTISFLAYRTDALEYQLIKLDFDKFQMNEIFLFTRYLYTYTESPICGRVFYV